VRILAGAGVAAVLLLGAAPALAHQGNPHYRSTVQQITPPVRGVTATVLNFDDRIQLQNTSGKTVVIDGYDGKPYARLLADRTVQVNTSNPAYYLNDDRYADVQVPKHLPAAPHWKLVDRTGRFEWHDHRSHYMSPKVPAKVKDQNARTFIFDWKVPIAVDGRKGMISGTLYWVPLPHEALPMGLIWGSAAALIVLCLGTIALRRRRRGDDAPAPGAPSEAW
jgi:hypothetical protein